MKSLTVNHQSQLQAALWCVGNSDPPLERPILQFLLLSRARIVYLEARRSLRHPIEALHARVLLLPLVTVKAVTVVEVAEVEGAGVPLVH